MASGDSTRPSDFTVPSMTSAGVESTRYFTISPDVLDLLEGGVHPQLSDRLLRVRGEPLALRTSGTEHLDLQVPSPSQHRVEQPPDQ